jgi:hypothetical protein
MSVRTWLGFGALLLTALSTTRAEACGVSASGIASCSLAEHDEAARPRWAVGLSGLYTSTRLRFSNSLRADETRYAALSSLAYMPSSKLLLQVGAGASAFGRLVFADQRYDFLPGPIGSLGADYRIVDQGRLFVMLTSSLSFSAARTRLGNDPSVGYQALDLRLGGELGVELLQVFRPYALARVFGGPVFWHYQGAKVTGTDTHHYQLGAGLGLRLSKSFNGFAEGVPLGERALSLGLGVAF